MIDSLKKFLFILLLTVLTIPSIGQNLLLKSPSLGDSWPAYSTQRIEWTSGNIDNILIEASYNAGKHGIPLCKAIPHLRNTFLG